MKYFQLEDWHLQLTWLKIQTRGYLMLESYLGSAKLNNTTKLLFLYRIDDSFLFEYSKYIVSREAQHKRAGNQLTGFLRGRRTQSLEEMKREPSLRMDQVWESMCQVAT